MSAIIGMYSNAATQHKESDLSRSLVQDADSSGGAILNPTSFFWRGTAT